MRENQPDGAALLLERGADPINAGMPDAAHRRHFQLRRQSNAGQLRSQVRARLGLGGDDDGQRMLSIGDAQSLVARGHGFESWAQLLNALENH